MNRVLLRQKEAGRKIVQAARKPNSVLSDHSSRLGIAAELQQPTRRFRLMAFTISLRLAAAGRCVLIA